MKKETPSKFVQPSFDSVKKIVFNTDNYFINHKEEIIGTKYDGLYFYWKAVKIETSVEFNFGAYPISHTYIEDPGNFGYFDPQLNSFFAYYIVQWIRYHAEDNKKEALEEILESPKKLKDIFIEYGKLVSDKENADTIIYCNELVPLLSSLKEKELKLISNLKRILPDDKELRFDFLVGISQNNTFNEYVYDKYDNEEIYILPKRKEKLEI